jgi:hypothetical protein
MQKVYSNAFPRSQKSTKKWFLLDID